MEDDTKMWGKREFRWRSIEDIGSENISIQYVECIGENEIIE